MKTVVALTAVCMLGGMPAILAAGTASPTQTLAVYRLSEQTTRCPADLHARLGCVKLKGKALTTGYWSEMQRIAAVDAPSPSVPPGCVTATTAGSLAGKDGTLHFKGAGYYCPKTDTAWYRLDFNAADAKHFDLPPYGSIDYKGKDNSEAFKVSSK